jgi:hypothetical protein
LRRKSEVSFEEIIAIDKLYFGSTFCHREIVEFSGSTQVDFRTPYSPVSLSWDLN